MKFCAGRPIPLLRACSFEYRVVLGIVDSRLQFIEKSIMTTEFQEFLEFGNGYIFCGIFE